MVLLRAYILLKKKNVYYTKTIYTNVNNNAPLHEFMITI